MSAAFVFGLIAFAAVLANLAIRDHRASVAARRSLLASCRGVLEDECWSAGDDGFPVLEGKWQGAPVKVALIPDTMIMRRLPQLWLSVTLKDHAAHTPALSILARYMGNEFYATTPDLPERLDPPPGLPIDIMIRGDGPRSQSMCAGLKSELAQLLADPKTKEITLTANGLRIIRQASEGRRGEHLLLRQAVFDDAEVPCAELEQTLAALERLKSARRTRWEVRAA